AAAARGRVVRDGAALDPRAAARAGALTDRRPENGPVMPGHLVAIPSWYKSARGSGGGYFRDQALALQRAGWRVAMLAPDIYTPRDLRRGEAPAVRGQAFRVDDDGLPTWRRNALVPVPRLPYRNAAAFALCGLRLFGDYRA